MLALLISNSLSIPTAHSTDAVPPNRADDSSSSHGLVAASKEYGQVLDERRGAATTVVAAAATSSAAQPVPADAEPTSTLGLAAIGQRITDRKFDPKLPDRSFDYTPGNPGPTYNARDENTAGKKKPTGRGAHSTETETGYHERSAIARSDLAHHAKKEQQAEAPAYDPMDVVQGLDAKDDDTPVRRQPSNTYRAFARELRSGSEQGKHARTERAEHAAAAPKCGRRRRRRPRSSRRRS